MSEPPPQPYTPYAASAPKPRPRALWFVLGAVMMLLGLVIGMVVIITAVRAATAEDGVITANGQAAAIASPANRSRMLFVQSGHTPPDCDLAQIRHRAAGAICSGKLGKVPFARTWIAGNRPNIGHKPDAGRARRRASITTSGSGRRRSGRSTPTASTTTGTGSGTTAPASSATTASTASTWSAWCSASTPRCASPRPAASTSTTTTSRRPTRRSPPSTSPARTRHLGAPHLVEDTALDGERLRHHAATARRARWSSTARAGTSRTATRRPTAKTAGLRARRTSSNFLDCVRDGKRPNADIEEGHKSTRLCHLGNIAYRTGAGTLRFDAATENARRRPGGERLLWAGATASRSSVPERCESPRPRRFCDATLRPRGTADGPGKGREAAPKSPAGHRGADWEKAKQAVPDGPGPRADLPDIHYGLATVYFQLAS